MLNSLTANKLRELFFRFFQARGHVIVPSAPMVIKNDPTLMFTNAGMNQFKDVFLGNQPPVSRRVADSQKCLRVSGKHNDLEEVGHDTYHHTMFEMLGNWSFGDYFKKEAIEWGWEFLTVELGIPEDRLYVTVYEGDENDGIPADLESSGYWRNCCTDPERQIIFGSKKDNFWEMGETGPCGPCSEIHADLRDDHERTGKPGHELVNKGHPLVLEIWNLVFIQYNRKSDGRLEQLPEKHVDTGMGFERLCMVVQGRKSNYDTDIFQPLIQRISVISGKKYGENESIDVAHRVIADHLRAVAFSIADGQLPSNVRAGYVIRRILRRAIRYGYTSLGMEEPFIYKLVPVLADEMGATYPELVAGKEQITKIIHEEEVSFLKTLGKGLKIIDKVIGELRHASQTTLSGKTAFELYDTYGFPLDLTRLILKENRMDLDAGEFENEMKSQKDRSRDDAAVEAGDWTIVRAAEGTLFTGYDNTEDEILVTRYRTIRVKGREILQMVFDRTPFYAESGGQAGDSGFIESATEKISISGTVRENNLVIHISDDRISDPHARFYARVDSEKRRMTAINHSATHLIHYALRSVLGKHVEQKGSLVTSDRLRFDFSHYARLSREELTRVEMMVNRMVRENVGRHISENITMDQAKKMGAVALFGEKYGDTVRVVTFGDSIELCGGTHIENTGSIGIVKIIAEGAIAAGIRRLEAVTASKAEEYINEKLGYADEIASMLKITGNLKEGVEKLIDENAALKKSLEKSLMQLALAKAADLEKTQKTVRDVRLFSGQLESGSPDTLKTIAYHLRSRYPDCAVMIGSETEGKASLLIMISESLVKSRKIDAAEIIREVAGEIKGGGGGQPFLATAGGRNPSGIAAALKKAEEYIVKLI